MLIPNKFNGYNRDGTRNLHIGGGVGEAALLNAMMTGAAVGGGTSIIQGKDPLQGALLGGLMGGAGAGVSSALILLCSIPLILCLQLLQVLLALKACLVELVRLLAN